MEVKSSTPVDSSAPSGQPANQPLNRRLTMDRAEVSHPVATSGAAAGPATAAAIAPPAQIPTASAFQRTASSAPRRAALAAEVHGGTLAQLSDEHFIEVVGAAFAADWQRLKQAVTAVESSAAPPLGAYGANDLTPSRLLFGADYSEVNRTLVSLLALKWLLAGDYEKFTQHQLPAIRLTPESFAGLRAFVQDRTREPRLLQAILVATAVKQLGKDPGLASEVEAKTGKRLDAVNHDVVLQAAAASGLIDSLQALDEDLQQDILRGLQMGSTLNAAQLAQAENVPGSLRGVEVVRGHPQAFASKFFELLLTVAGASGHVDSRSAIQMTEPVYQGLMTTHQALQQVVAGHATLRQAYDQVLRRRAGMLQQRGFRALDVASIQERALLRLMTMGRVATAEQAAWFDQAFAALPSDVRACLVNGLRVDGVDDGEAILPYFMPGLFAAGIKNAPEPAATGKVAAIGSMMSFLARVYGGSAPQPGRPGSVVERNLAYAQDVIKSAAFKQDPSTLAKVEIPWRNAPAW